MSSPLIKYCGLTRTEDVALAVAAGARYLGGIRAGGPRHLEPAAWRALLAPRTDGLERVAVLGAAAPDALIDEIGALSPDIAQLHGDPTADDVRVIARATGVTLWPVLRLTEPALPTGVHALSEVIADVGGALVIDSHVAGQLGGTGVPLPWSQLAASITAWRRDHPGVRLVLAGGLRAENVASAIALLGPDVVDVSSGVEAAAGIKDPARVRAFARAVLNPDGE